MNNQFEKNARMVHCVDGKSRKHQKCVGFCNSTCHKGYVTAKLLEEHCCIEKNCNSLRKITSHPFWENRDREEEKKREKKDLIKKHKETERKIIEQVSEYVQKDKIVLCKHLYDNTYVLILLTNASDEWLKEILSEAEIHLFIKVIRDEQKNNIEYTYRNLLPDNMRENLIKYNRLKKKM